MLFKRILVRIINGKFVLKEWLSYSQWKAWHRTLWKFVNTTQYEMPPNSIQKNSFTEVARQFEMDDIAIHSRKQYFLRLAQFWLVFCMSILLYAVYLIAYHAWLSVIAVSVVELMALSQAFQYHFWYFQLSQQRLDCTFKEWYTAFIQGKLVC